MADVEASPYLVYKILTGSQGAAWQALTPISLPDGHSAKLFEGAGIDVRDGYIHLSTAGQAGETYDKFFAPPRQPGEAEGCGDGQGLDRNGEPLVIVEVDLRQVLGKVCWDPVPGRRGEAFAHIYGGGVPLVEQDSSHSEAQKASAVARVWKGPDVGRQLFDRIAAESAGNGS